MYRELRLHFDAQRWLVARLLDELHLALPGELAYTRRGPAGAGPPW
jgi:hypothetical protein